MSHTFRPHLFGLLLASLAACGSEHAENGNDRDPRDPSPEQKQDPAIPRKPDAGGDGDAGRTEPMQPTPTTLVVENRGEVPVVVGSECDGPIITASFGEIGSTLPFCSCDCTDAASELGCPSCTTECRVTQELLFPGERREVPWDGRGHEWRPEPGCHADTEIAEGTTLTARACFSTHDGDAGLTCATTDFSYGVDTEAVVVVEPRELTSAATELVLENDSATPISIVTEQCGSQAWASVELGDDSSVVPFCGCTCRGADEPVACPDCEPCAEPVVEVIAPGASARWTWTGEVTHAYDAICTSRFAVPTGLHGKARACFRREGATEDECVTSSMVVGDARVELFVP